MNEIFKQSKKIRINLQEDFFITTDNFKGICLVNYFPATRKNKKTEKKEDYIQEVKYYYPTVGQALKKYVELSQNSAKNLTDIVEKTDKILKVVDEFKEKYRNWV